jgi:hypothetical protein
LESGIAARLLPHDVEIPERVGDQHGPRGSRAGQGGNGIVIVEQHEMRQLADFTEAPPGHARLPRGGDDAAHQAEQQQRCRYHAGFVPSHELRKPVPARSGPGLDRVSLQVAAKVFGELVDGSVAPRGFLAQRHLDDFLQIRIEAPAGPGAHSLRLGGTNLARQVHGAGGVAVGPDAGKQLVHEDAQRVDVAGGGDGRSLHLFRAGVFRCHRARSGLGARGRSVQVPGNPEIQQLRLAGAPALGPRDQNVGGLQIAVDDQVRVRIKDGRTDLAE